MARINGRPPKQGITRSVSLNIRLTPEEAKRIEKCAADMNATRTDAIMEGITLLENSKKE